MLYVAAHPDDENTQLIAYFSRGRQYRTAYLSLTRGDGGQNVLGPELGEELGVIRTQELLAARRIDGGRQFFTRAIDFGFSKSYQETLGIWDEQQVLADIVRVIRTFRPDVIVTRFPIPPGSGGHGHHTASAILAVEAFKRAGDPAAFPEQIRAGLAPWQARRVLWNVFSFGGGPPALTGPTVKIDISGSDPVTGEPFGTIANRSRGMHKTQGLGGFSNRPGDGPRPETFILLAGDAPTADIMDGIDTSWGRFPGGADIGRLAGDVIAQFNPQAPAASLPALLALRRQLAALPADPVVAEKRRALDRMVQACLGLTVRTVVPDAEVAPGETLHLHHTATVAADTVPVRWVGLRYPGIGRETTFALDLRPQEPVARDDTETLPAEAPLSQPYWLRAEGTVGVFRVDDPALIGRPENPPAFPVEDVFEVGGQTLVVADEPVQVGADGATGENLRRLEVVAPVSLRFGSEVELFTAGAVRPAELEITAHRAGVAGAARLVMPAGWTVAPATQSFHLAAVGDRVRCKFQVTAPAQAGTADIAAEVEIGGRRYAARRVEIRYAHIPVQLLQPPAHLKVVDLALAIRGRQIGYVPGAGDNVAESLEEMGCTVTRLTGAELDPQRLSGLDAVVIGIRAFNVRTDLAPQLPALVAFAEAGGTVIVQYNNPNGLAATKLAPFDLKIANERVTDERAPMTLLAPDHPVLNTPNKITSADFEGWVQERGLYFASQWDEHFTPILACNDPGEPPKQGSLLVAHCGRGYFVYTGLAFFRQLPAGVPGAYRLLANLVSLGK
ncbi:MAG TPA: PIG-L family deacetylase [Opitutaceae bacterium]|nr:PIG-L family deacetylase [Opitutaceae bacterium]